VCCNAPSRHHSRKLVNSAFTYVPFLRCAKEPHVCLRRIDRVEPDRDAKAELSTMRANTGSQVCS
jgi:hypothetical protein